MTVSTSDEQILSRQHDWEGDQTLSMTVLEAIADATEADLTELPPLYEQIDPDALDRVFTHNAAYHRMEGTVSFGFAGHSIKVHSSGKVIVSRT